MEDVIEPLPKVGAPLRYYGATFRQQPAKPLALARGRVCHPAEAGEGGLDGLDHVPKKAGVEPG